MTDKRPSKSPAAARRSAGFSAAEQAAMKARAQELKAEARASKARKDGERDVIAAIAQMPEADRGLAQGIHEIVAATAPDLMPRTWYGMPAYARDGKVVCFFQAASKFGSRYATLGFNDEAGLDDGSMWPTAFAVTKLTAANKTRIRALVKKATE